MKKKISIFLMICLLIPCVFMLCACNNKDLTTSLTLLKQDQTLNIGTNIKLKNYKETKTEEFYLECPVSANVVLRRTLTNNRPDCAEYNNQWYYWEVTTITDNFLIGNKTIITSGTYSYLFFGTDNNNIVVKTTTKVETKYDFTTKEFSKECAITYNLNGYFFSIHELQSKAPDLYSKLTISDTNKFYIQEPKTTYSYSEDTYKDTYFYFS